MPRKMTRKQLMYFGTKRQRASLKSPTRTSKRTGVSMARRVRRRSYSFGRRISRRVGRGLTPSKLAVGVVGAVITEPMFTGFLPIVANPVVQLGGGYLLSKKAGIVGGVGAGYMAIGLIKLLSGMNLGGVLGGASSTGAYEN